MPSSLRCPACGATYTDRWRCSCGHALDFAEQPLPDGPPPAFGDLDTRRGLWAFAEFLPVERRVSLGEGMTPLVAAPEWDATFKLEYVFPTGSFKDRGASAVVSRALELGHSRVIEDSSGNAGAAVATYAARAGIDAEIYVPADAKASKLRAIERAGADVIPVEGSRADVTAACIAAIEDDATSEDDTATEDNAATETGESAWYASHAWNPAFYAGTQTVAFEIAAARDWRVPDAVVMPLGHGTLFLGAYRGFRALREAGWTDRLPRLLGAQAAGYAPVAERLHGPTEGENEIADGIQIRKPARPDQVLDAIEDTEGDAIALEERAVENTLDRLHAAGFYTEPTCAVAPAALEAYRERGVLHSSDDVVVALTGSGLKN